MQVNTDKALRIPVGLHSKLKIRAIEEGVNLGALTNRVLTEYLIKAYSDDKKSPVQVED